MQTRVVFLLVLLVLGTGWGLTVPLAKIAASTGRAAFGLMTWELVFIVAILASYSTVRGRRMPTAPRYLLRYAVIAFCGTIVPSAILWRAAAILPGGVLAILVSLVPIFALPIALALRLERASLVRALGVACGAVAIVLIAGPEAGLPDPDMAPWVLIGAIAPFMYAVEANWVARYGVLDLEPDQVILGASTIALLIAAPLALATGSMYDITEGWAAPEWALLASALIHSVVYALYVWLVGRAGSVFASQTAYLVTATGVLWSMAILAETYSIWFWVALAVLLVGLFLVRPQDETPLAVGGTDGDNGAVT
jgi:drug/metabolite transporter (DMT)-like permease